MSNAIATDPWVGMKVWGLATLVAFLAWVATMMGFQYFDVPIGNTVTVLSVEAGIAVFCAQTFRVEAQAKARADEQTRMWQEEARKREEEDRQRKFELEQVARKADEVKAALVESNNRHNTQVEHLQGSVDTMHNAVVRIEGFTDGAHGVVLRALAASLAREAALPGASRETMRKALQAEEAANRHDQQLAIHNADAQAKQGGRED